MEKESTKIIELVRSAKELREYTAEALEIAQQKDEKLFGNAEKTEQCKPIAGGGGLIEEISLNIAITMNSMHDIIEFLKKL